ncbi:MAG: hypothetical protein KIC94_17960 [Clostridiales bacterium]|nr:hypothetical protein [Clostridiales bacterium]
MKTICLQPIHNWMHRNARELELARWKYLFEDGDKMEVVNALMYYQNPDGGFGNAVDPDNWNQNSVPYGTYFVLEILKEINFFDLNHPIYIGIKKYLDCTSNFLDGWVFTLPSNQEFPHAAYYNYDAEYNKVESKGIIISFCSFILEYYPQSEIYDEILTIVDTMIRGMYEENQGDMGAAGYVTLFLAMKKAKLPNYNYSKIEQRLKELVNCSIQREPEQWLSYGYRPSAYINSKDSMFYVGNEEIVEKELDFLVDTLPHYDVWPISWSWFENNVTYPKESSISENWSKAYKTIEKVIFLRNFGRINKV